MRRAIMNGASSTTPKASPSTIIAVLAPPVERSASSIMTGLKPQPAAVTSDSATTVPAEAGSVGSVAPSRAGAWGSGSAPIQREIRATPTMATMRPTIVRPAMVVPTMTATNTAVNSGSVQERGPTTPTLPERSA